MILKKQARTVPAQFGACAQPHDYPGDFLKFDRASALFLDPIVLRVRTTHMQEPA